MKDEGKTVILKLFVKIAIIDKNSNKAYPKSTGKDIEYHPNIGANEYISIAIFRRDLLELL